MTSKDLTYQDIVKLRKELEKNKGGFYEHPIVITYGQAIQIESECLALQQENEKLKKALDILKGKLELCESIYSQVFNSNEYYLLCNKTLTQQEYDLLKEVLGDA